MKTEGASVGPTCRPRREKELLFTSAAYFVNFINSLLENCCKTLIIILYLLLADVYDVFTRRYFGNGTP